MAILIAPKGRFAGDKERKKRKEIAERLKNNKEVNVTASGQIVDPDDDQAESGKVLVAPEGKLA